jgi:hypothetical protein
LSLNGLTTSSDLDTGLASFIDREPLPAIRIHLLAIPGCSAIKNDL